MIYQTYLIGLNLFLYSDDANIIINGANIADIVQQLNELCNILPNWVISNGLALNLKKTKYMLFSRQNIELPDEFKILKEVRFLGVIVDEKLNWSAHIKTLKSKMSRYIGILCKIKKLLPIQAKMQIFQSLI